MKRMLLAAFSALAISASAQITVTNSTFPVAGDTLYFAFDEEPDGINPATPPGGGQVWDFTALNADNRDITVYRPANQGVNFFRFPSADIMQGEGANGEVYYNVTGNKYEILGFAGGNLPQINVPFNTAYSPALVERRSPMNFFDIENTQSNLGLTFPTDQSPFLDSIFSSLPVNIDSMRLRTTIDRREVVDGWGSCIIPGGQYQVLRKKRTDISTNQVELYVAIFPGFGNWIDLSTLLGGAGGGGGGLGALTQPDTTITFRFYSGTEKEEIAVATMSNDISSVVNVRFKDNGVSAVDELYEETGATITAFPNPAVDWVRFDCSNLPQEEYTLKIYNIIGKVVWKETYQLSGNRSIRIDLDNFKKGTYLYNLSDSRGRSVGTKRLVILKP